MSGKNPQVVTIYGRLSFPTFTAQEAFARSQKGSYPAATVADAAPDFQLLVEQAQHDKLHNHVVNEFFPFVLDKHTKGEKGGLEDKELKKLLADITGDLADQNFNTPFKPIHEKTAPLAPECVSAIKVIGNKGVDMEIKAIVNGDDELSIPEPDLITFPAIRPINKTVHTMYPGCYVAVTLNLYAYRNGKNPGFSAGGTVPIFKADGDRFGGGVSVDEDEIFAD